mgnify:CR=1 FL=1
MSKNALENSKRENLSMTCIICPMGCSMEVSLIEEGGNKTVTEVKDNGCHRGEDYARKEVQNPTRTLTTTILVQGGNLRVLPVKSSGEVPKKMLLNCMEVIRRSSCRPPIKRGDILIKDILGTGKNIIACADVMPIN